MNFYRWQRGVVALALGFSMSLAAGCVVTTEYTPRSNNQAFLSMKDFEPGLYKNGRNMTLDSAVWAVGCDRQTEDMVSAASGHHRSRKTSELVAGALIMGGVFIPLLDIPGFYFLAVAEESRQKAAASTVDGINRHNDVLGCTQTEEAQR